jgi:LytS/YehU family sensor histidine kinase
MPSGRLREAMNGKENPLELLVMCAVVIVLSILGVVGGLSRRLFGGLDGLLMLSSCLLMALIAALLLLWLAREQGWLGKHKQEDAPAVAPPKAK